MINNNDSNSNLNKHLEAKQNRLSELENGLNSLQQQVNELQQQLRVENQLQKAQQSVFKEFHAQKQAFKKLLKDACSCFDIDALKDFVEDLKSIQEDVEANYENLQNSDRFLNSEQAEAEDFEEKSDLQLKNFLLVSPAIPLPNETDDLTTLNVNHVEQLLTDLSPEQLSRIQRLLNLNAKIKVKSKIYQQIAELNLTRVKLSAILSLLSVNSPSLFTLNGNLENP